jgi:hypothetical protein
MLVRREVRRGGERIEASFRKAAAGMGCSGELVISSTSFRRAMEAESTVRVHYTEAIGFALRGATVYYHPQQHRNEHSGYWVDFSDETMTFDVFESVMKSTGRHRQWKRETIVELAGRDERWSSWVRAYMRDYMAEFWKRYTGIKDPAVVSPYLSNGLSVVSGLEVLAELNALQTHDLMCALSMPVPEIREIAIRLAGRVAPTAD